MDVVLVHFILINHAVRISYVRSPPICCVFVSEASFLFVCIVFSVLFMSTHGVSEASFRFLCTRGVMDVVLLSNKIMHHPVLENYHTSTLKNYKKSGQLFAQSVTTFNNVFEQLLFHQRTVVP